MKVFDSIINVLKKDGYKITEDTKARINQLLECLQDENRFRKLDQFIECFKKQRIK